MGKRAFDNIIIDWDAEVRKITSAGAEIISFTEFAKDALTSRDLKATTRMMTYGMAALDGFAAEYFLVREH